jgi:hypothetical protein
VYCAVIVIDFHQRFFNDIQLFQCQWMFWVVYRTDKIFSLTLRMKCVGTFVGTRTTNDIKLLLF